MKPSFANRPLQILVDGSPLDARLTRCAVSALVRQTLNAPSVAEIAFAEPPKELTNLRFGSKVGLQLNSGQSLFTGELTTIERGYDGAEGRVLRLRAYDLLHRLRKTQRSRALKGVSAGDLAMQAAQELGIVCSAEESGPTSALVIQHDQSDLELLVEMAGASGLYLCLDDDTLRLVTLAGTGEPIALKVGRDLSVVRAISSVEAIRRSTDVKAWNVARTSVISASVSLARQDSAELRALDTKAFGDIGKRSLLNRLAATASQCDGLAQADFDRATARGIVLEACADGNPAIRPGATISVSGADDPIDGRFTITSALHRFAEDAGYLTEFSTDPPKQTTRSSRTSLTVGHIFELADPEQLSRVRAKLPLFGDVETEWMPVLTVGAGDDKGLSVLPEVGDDVLIALPDGNPATGVVLGGLFGERKAPGLVPGNTRPFVFRTSNGQAITLDSDNALARIQTSGGDVLELGPKGSRLHSANDLLIEAPGRTLTIRAKAVEFEES